MPYCDRFGKIRLEAFDGARYDFLGGVRIEVPHSCKARHFRLIDVDTAQVMREFDAVPEEEFECVKRVRELISRGFTLQNLGREMDPAPEDSLVFHNFEDTQFFHWKIEQMNDSGEIVFEDTMDLTGKEVWINSASYSLGDSIAWFQPVVDFQKKWKCETHLITTESAIDLFKSSYPEIFFHKKTPNDDYILDRENAYAEFELGVRIGKTMEDWRGRKFLDPFVSLRDRAFFSLGLPSNDEIPKVSFPEERLIPEKYICISVSASIRSKCWNYPDGWNILCRELKKMGYRVICIDKFNYTQFEEGSFIQVPEEAEDFTGDFSLSQRLQLLHGADLLISGVSGLILLTWLLKKRPVVIRGSSLEDLGGSYEPVEDVHACRGCLDYFPSLSVMQKCKFFQDSERAFECTRSITPEMVMHKVKKVLNLA